MVTTEVIMEVVMLNAAKADMGRPPRHRRRAAGAGPAAPLVVSAYRRQGWSIASVAGELDLATGPLLRNVLDEELTDHGTRVRIIVDFTCVAFCDPSGLGVLVGAHSRALQRGDEFRLVCPEGHVRRFFRLTRPTHALPLYETLHQALTA
jgi:anti-sigma B factor antagonist